MKVQLVDKKHGIVRVVPEVEDDLWVLHTVISEGDLVRARTTREVKSEKRGTSRRVPVTITLRVKYSEFQAFTNRLRIHGVITEGPDKYGLKGSHHTINVTPGTEILIAKPAGWPPPLLERLIKRRPRPVVIIASIDYDEYAVGVLLEQGLKVILDRSLELPGKGDPSRAEVLASKLSEVAKVIRELVEKEGARAVVLAGPGTLKHEVAARLRLPDGVKAFVENTSTGGTPGLYEVLRRGATLKILSEFSAVLAESVLDEFFKLLTKEPGLVAYTLEEVRSAAEAGAIKKLLILDDLVRSYDADLRKAVEETLLRADATRSDIIIVGSSSPAGEKLRQLGGVIAVLRFKVFER